MNGADPLGHAALEAKGGPYELRMFDARGERRMTIDLHPGMNLVAVDVDRTGRIVLSPLDIDMPPATPSATAAAP